MKSVGKRVLAKFLQVSILIAIAALYSIQTLKQIAGLCALVLLILLFAHRFLPDTKSSWITKFALVSIALMPFTSSKLGALSWIIWNVLVCFVLLRPKSNFGTVRTLCANLVIFVFLFSSVEVVFRFLETSEGTQTSDIFVDLQKKNYYKFASLISEADRVDGPSDEYDFVHRERIKSSGDLITLEDFKGSYINIEDGRRVTSGSTGSREKRILVFGGSTIMCGEVPDSMTVTSNLQKLIVENNLEFDVFNYGISGLRIENQFKILETIVDLNSNDIVVFYDGVNDLNRIFERGLEQRSSQTPWWQINKLAKALEQRSLLLRKVSITNYVDGLGVSQLYLDEEVVGQIADNWLKFDATARTYVESKGAKFLHILQPNWVTFKGGDEAIKLKKHWSDMKMIQTDFDSYATSAMQIEDFTKIFDGLSTPPFFDWAHIDEIGTAKVAEEMFKVLEPLLKEQSK